MPTPEPNSPEAKRAAEKIRNAFYVIAVANLALVIFVMWPRGKSPAKAPESSASETPAAPKVPPSPEKKDTKPASTLAALTPAEDATLAEMEKLTDTALDGYNKRDAERFARGFSANAIPPVNEEYFRDVVIPTYRDEFGELTNKKRIDAETKLHADLKTIVYEAEAKKHPKVKVSITFRQEGGVLKIMHFLMGRL
jgi:hypothetical protein